MHSNDYIIIFFIIFFILAIVVTKWTQGSKKAHNGPEDGLTADERVTDEKDMEGLSSLYKSINTANQNVWACVCYSTDEEEKTINVHSSLPVVLTGGIEDIDGYITHMLKRFFMAQRIVRTEFDRLRASAK